MTGLVRTSREIFDLLLSLFATHAIEFEHEEFALADSLNAGIAEIGERVLDRLPLRVQHSFFQHYPDMSFHHFIRFNCAQWPLQIKLFSVELYQARGVQAGAKSLKKVPFLLRVNKRGVKAVLGQPRDLSAVQAE
jgi:hypothetical protein